MTKAKQRQLMRLLHGELPPAEVCRLERELERDAGLRDAYARLARLWNGLELPPAEVPADFAAAVMAAAREARGDELSWSLAPAWARGGAAAALATGLLLGAVFATGFATPGTGDDTVLVADADADALPLSLAEVYWLALEDGADLPLEDGAEDGR